MTFPDATAFVSLMFRLSGAAYRIHQAKHRAAHYRKVAAGDTRKAATAAGADRLRAPYIASVLS